MSVRSVEFWHVFDDAGVDFSCFVGDLAPDVTDYVLQEEFRRRYPSVRAAKASLSVLFTRDKFQY